jgi:hypothetical protein
MNAPKLLPLDWLWLQPGRTGLQTEYEIELSEIHPLRGIKVDVIARCKSNDDILVRHRDAEDRVSVVHLTWSQKQERPNFPFVEFTGTHAGFIEWEFKTYGVGTTESAP